MRSCPDTDIDPSKNGPTGVTGGGACPLARFTSKKRITDHGYKNFVFPSLENKQVRYSF